VHLPARLSAALGKGRVNVRGTVNGVEIRTSAVPVAGGRHMMFLNRRIREEASAVPGARVKVVLARDGAPREDPMPEDLILALRHADALGPFQRIARSTRNEIIRWIDDAKMETTREKRIGRAVERGLAARDKEIDREALRAAKADRVRAGARSSST
jgi:hypothetical protein